LDISQRSECKGVIQKFFTRAGVPSRSLCLLAGASFALLAVASAREAAPAAGGPDPGESAVSAPASMPQLSGRETGSPSSAEPEAVSKRLFGVIPNHRADQATDSYQPLTLAEKYKIAREDTFDWPNFPLLAGYALQAQVAAGGFHHNGGMQGFGDYYARGFADQVIGSYVTEAILPGLFHEDPRFFRIGTGSFVHRVAYAASRTFVTRGDNGKNRFFASEVLGNAAVSALGSLYYPHSATMGEIGEHYAMQLGNDAVSNMLTEFWPDIRLRLRFVRQHLFTSLFNH
jgi:hypothetical protein